MATFYQKITDITRGIRFRLSVVYSALFGVCLVLLSLFITGEYLDFAREEHDQFLRNFAIDLSHFVKPGIITKNMSLDVPLSEKIKYFPFVIQNTVVSIRNLDGEILYTNRKDIDVPFIADFAKTQTYSHRFMNFQKSDDTRMRGINLKIPHEDTPLILQVASTVENLTIEQDRHFYILALIIPLAILISAFISSLVAGQALDPIRAIILKMEELLEADSYKPLMVPQSRDEISKLAETYNVMLSKVKKTLDAQDQFVAHASHQLNTPLAIMRGELEVLLSKERPLEEMEKFHKSLAQELDRMSLLVRDMLLVSRVEAGKAHFNFSPVRLDEIVTENVARLGPKAKQKQIALKFDLDTELIEHDQYLVILGERQLLGCLVENLIENAIKYSPSNSIIFVNLKLTANGISFEIKDQGPGIPQDVRARLESSERFFRGEHTASIAGSGLGLYLVRKIADYHSSKLEILDAPTFGAHFRVTFSQNPKA